MVLPRLRSLCLQYTNDHVCPAGLESALSGSSDLSGTMFPSCLAEGGAELLFTSCQVPLCLVLSASHSSYVKRQDW